MLRLWILNIFIGNFIIMSYNNNKEEEEEDKIREKIQKKL